MALAVPVTKHDPKTINQLRTPAFLVDINKVKKNCSKMLQLCSVSAVKLRAQTKTHKTIEGAVLQTGGSRECIVTSTLSEVEFYAAAGFDDILYGYPLTSDKVDRCVEVMKVVNNFHIMIDAEHCIPTLLKEFSKLKEYKKKWSVFLKVDCGNGRAGVWHADDDGIRITRTLQASPQVFTFQGIYIHCGNSYSHPVNTVVMETVDRAVAYVERLQASGIPCKEVGIGSTPSCSRGEMSECFSQLTEIHPGNYIFYDMQQVSLSSCTLDDVACTVATRVIGHYPRRKQVLVDAGFTCLSKQHEDTTTPGLGYGVVRGDPALRLLAMTQEIGKVTTYDGSPLDYSRYPVGSMLFIYPWHSCATAGLHSVYYIHDGEHIIDQWTPNKGW